MHQLLHPFWLTVAIAVICALVALKPPPSASA